MDGKEKTPEKSRKGWTKRLPIISAVAALVLYIVFESAASLIELGARLAAGITLESPTGTPYDFISESIGIVWPFLIVLIFGNLYVYRRKGFAKSLKVGMYLLISGIALGCLSIMACAADPETVWQSPVMMLAACLMLFGVGFREESVFRGIIAENIGLKYAKDIRGIWLSVIVSATFFMALHIPNLFAGMEPLPFALQLVGTFAGGMLLTAIYYRSGSLWGVIFLHALNDLAGLFLPYFTLNGGTEIEAMNDISWPALIMSAVEALVTVYLLRKKKAPEIIENFRGQDPQ